MNKKLFGDIERTAMLSPCERYRFQLGRHWDRENGFVLFVMLNPSTADANQDDPTIRRCMDFAKSWGYGGIEVCNLFDWRATDPKHLRNKLAIAKSDMCDMKMRRRARQAKLVIAAWGAVPWANGRIEEIFRDVFDELDKRWYCLRFTKEHYPAHPLYIPKATQPTLFW